MNITNGIKVNFIDDDTIIEKNLILQPSLTAEQLESLRSSLIITDEDIINIRAGLVSDTEFDNAINNLDSRTTDVEDRATSLESRATSLESRATALENRNDFTTRDFSFNITLYTNFLAEATVNVDLEGYIPIGIIDIYSGYGIILNGDIAERPTMSRMYYQALFNGIYNEARATVPESTATGHCTVLYKKNTQ